MVKDSIVEIEKLSPRGVLILDAAQKLFYDLGFDETSLAMIINETGGSRRSIYNEFGNKHGLLMAVIQRQVKTQSEILTSINRDLDAKEALNQVCFKFVVESKINGCKVVMQINHPGRQVFSKMGGKVLSASDVALDMGKHSHLFGQPKAMNEAQIQDVIKRFVQTAQRAEEAGFDGVQIHAAHGYLLAQFLSPLTNKRNDNWGGSIENRARLLLTITREIKQACGAGFSVSVKLNSADFQRGGFEPADAQDVVDMLGELNIDFVELSGGSYEAPAMQGNTADTRTLAREAYFLEFAQAISAHSSVPIMTTGGITRLPVAQKVVDSGVALVGMATALAFTPDLPNQWQHHHAVTSASPKVTWKDKTLSGLATMALVKRQIRRVGEGKNPKGKLSPVISLILDQIRAAKLTKRYRKRFRNELS